MSFITTRCAPATFPPTCKILRQGGNVLGPFVFSRDWTDGDESGETFYTATHSATGGVQSLTNTAVANNGRADFASIVPVATTIVLEVDFQWPTNGVTGPSMATRAYIRSSLGGATDAISGYACDISTPAVGVLDFRILRYIASAAAVLTSVAGVTGTPGATAHFTLSAIGTAISATCSGATVNLGLGVGVPRTLSVVDANIAQGSFGLGANSGVIGGLKASVFDNLQVTYFRNC